MNYNEIKAARDNVYRDIIKVRGNIKTLTAQFESLSTKKHNLENELNSKYADAKNIAEKKWTEQSTAPLNEELEKLKDRLRTTEMAYVEKKNAISREEVEAEFLDEKQRLDDITDLAEELKLSVQNAVGEAFYNNIMQVVKDSVTKVKAEDLDYLLEYMDYYNAKMSSGSKGNKIDSLVSKLHDAMETVSFDNFSGNTILTGVVTLASAAAMVMAFQVVFPVYVIGLIGLSAYYVHQSFDTYSVLLIQNAVSSNLNDMNQELTAKVNARMQERLDEIDTTYTLAINDLQQQIKDKEQEITAQYANSRQSFVFDATAFSQERDMLVSKHDADTMRVHSELLAAQNELDKLNASFQTYEASLKQVVGDLKSQFLSFDVVGTAHVLDPKFLFDIKDNKPVFFQHPQKSCLFLYKQPDDVYAFIRLLCVQLRSKLTPYDYDVIVYDKKKACTDFSQFSPNTSSVPEKHLPIIKHMFRMITKEKEFSDILEDVEESFDRKRQNILRDYPSIVQYNEFMKSIDAMTEPYQFMFVLDPTNTQLTTDTFLQILRVGAGLGMYSHVFISKDEFYKMSETAKTVTDAVGSIFELSSSSINSRAKDFVLENYIKPSNS